MTPEISIVIPTTGSMERLERCINSLVTHSPESLLNHVELIVFLNTREKNLDEKIRERLFDLYGASITKLQVKFSDTYLWTAEESAYEACNYATKEYIWICGDQRIFLPIGLEELNRTLNTENPEGVFFNNTWVDTEGMNLGKQSIITQSITNKIRYKDFVLMAGYNYMPTNFGSWIVKRKYLDRDIWKEVALASGWHFSHVATYLISMSDIEIIVNATYLIQMEVKDYHLGDSTGWEEYARRNRKVRFSPWVETLPKQLDYLIQKKVISYHELKVALVNEGDIFKRLVDELYLFAILQIKLSLDVRKEQLSKESFLVIRGLLKKASSERMHANSLLDQMYFKRNLSKREFNRIQKKIEKIIFQDSVLAATPLVSLIIGSISDFLIRVHPSGYVLSPKNDSSFLEKYRILNKRNSKMSVWTFYKNFEEIREIELDLDLHSTLKRNGRFRKKRVRNPRRRLKPQLRGFFIFLLRFRIFIVISYFLPLKLKRWFRRKL